MLPYDAEKGMPNESFAFLSLTTIFLSIFFFGDRGLRPFQVLTFLRR